MSRQDFERGLSLGFGLIVGAGLAAVLLGVSLCAYWRFVPSGNPRESARASESATSAPSPGGSQNASGMQENSQTLPSSQPDGGLSEPGSSSSSSSGLDDIEYVGVPKRNSSARQWNWRNERNEPVAAMAELIAVDGDRIQLRDEEGTMLTVAIRRLCNRDQAWIEENVPREEAPSSSVESGSLAKDDSCPTEKKDSRANAKAERPGEPPRVVQDEPPAGSRAWTDAGGRHKIHAGFLDCKGGILYLEKAGGAVLGVPLAELSETDRRFVSSVTFPTESMTGKVTGIVDGDTITVLDESNQLHKVKLRGIDSPERSQPFGAAARRTLGNKVSQKNVVVEWIEKNTDGRILGDVILDGRWINKEMLDEGMARYRAKEFQSEVLSHAEASARDASAGLWRDKIPAAPANFHREQRPAALSPL